MRRAEAAKAMTEGLRRIWLRFVGGTSWRGKCWRRRRSAPWSQVDKVGCSEREVQHR